MQIIYLQFQLYHIPFMLLKSTGFKRFVKIMRGSYVFRCSSCISIKPTTHLNSQKIGKCWQNFQIGTQWVLMKIFTIARHRNQKLENEEWSSMLPHDINLLKNHVSIIQKPINWVIVAINWLVSLGWKYWKWVEKVWSSLMWIWSLIHFLPLFQLRRKQVVGFY